MKILIISHFFPYPFFGGGGRRFQAFIKILQERHEITFVTFVNNKKNEEDIEAFRNEWPGVEIITVPCPENKSFNRLNRIKWLLNPWVRPVRFSCKMKEVIEGLNDTHDSLATNRTNEVVRMLTVIATIMLPITVVASIFGMNIPLGPFEKSNLAPLFIFLVMLVIIGGMLYFFRRQRWI